MWCNYRYVKEKKYGKTYRIKTTKKGGDISIFNSLGKTVALLN